MNKYVFAECPIDYWPRIRTIMANSYNNAVEKLIKLYGEEFDDDTIISDIEEFKYLREYLNDKYNLALSDIEVYEEL